MRRETLQALEKIGKSLDKGLTPTVHNGRIVMPGRATETFVFPGRENTNVRQETRGSATGSRQRPARGERTPSSTASVVCDTHKTIYRAEANEIENAYPGARFIWTSDGFWLFTKSRLIPGHDDSASIISYIPFSKYVSRSWGFWSSGEWIGPRHTNFPDGSICSFEPSDRTWCAGDSIVDLLDLHTLWIVGQLHLRHIGTWPGPQCVRHSYERITELGEDELCGCDSEEQKTYGECCMINDLRGNRVRQAMNFILTHNGGVRQPPASVRKLIHVFSNPPEHDPIRAFS